MELLILIAICVGVYVLGRRQKKRRIEAESRLARQASSQASATDHRYEIRTEVRTMREQRNRSRPTLKTNHPLAPKPEDPWFGRQYEPVDEDDKPNGFPTWTDAFNRPVTDSLKFQIEYADGDGEVTERTIEPKSIHLLPKTSWVYIKADCSLRGADRSFRSDRILSTRNLQTNRPLKNLGQYLRSRY